MLKFNKRILTLSFVILTFLFSSGIYAFDDALDPYVDFLNTQDMPAEEYILKLFETHDLVVICERDHRDISQYDLFLNVIKDERFIKNVGNVFTEIGNSNLNPILNEFLQSGNLPADSVSQKILNFQRHCCGQYDWEKQSYGFLLTEVYKMNQNLIEETKIRLYPSDMPFDWNQMDSTKLIAYRQSLNDRDSIIAYQIIDSFDKILKSNSPRKKALVIMNYRHAFNKNFVSSSGRVRSNVGGYLSDYYGDRFANVYLNFASVKMRSTDGSTFLDAIQDGKWDASFIAAQKDNIGFDFSGSPFGDDELDIWPLRDPLYNYKDVFTGFVYYLPPEKFRVAVGIPGYIDSVFYPEYIRRDQIKLKADGKDTSLYDDIDDLIEYYNTPREFPPDYVDSLKVKIDQWLK